MEDYAVRTPPMEQLRQELAEILDSGAKTLTLSGGEPTLYRDRVLELCREATSRGVQFIEIQTNAVLVDADYALALAESGVTAGSSWGKATDPHRSTHPVNTASPWGCQIPPSSITNSNRQSSMRTDRRAGT